MGFVVCEHLPISCHRIECRTTLLPNGPVRAFVIRFSSPEYATPVRAVIDELRSILVNVLTARILKGLSSQEPTTFLRPALTYERSTLSPQTRGGICLEGTNAHGEDIQLQQLYAAIKVFALAWDLILPGRGGYDRIAKC